LEHAFQDHARSSPQTGKKFESARFPAPFTTDVTAPETFGHTVDLANGSLRVLLRLEDFKGWEIGALWEELKFDARHLRDFGRIALSARVGSKNGRYACLPPSRRQTCGFFQASRKPRHEYGLV
jgi:hypothetical protein